MIINYNMLGMDLTGGVRVILEIADGLVSRGHDVCMTSLGPKNSHKWFGLRARTNYIEKQGIGRAFELGIRSGLSRIFEIDLNPYLAIKRLSENTPDCDINVATACFTAFSVFRSDKGVPFYHMQHYEPLFFDEEYLKRFAEETYYLPLNRIANSIWLRNQMKDKYDYDVPVVNPAIDHNVFYPRPAHKNISKMRVVCFGKQARWKGFPEALSAMELVRKSRADVELIVYGIRRPSYESNVPYHFVKAPTDQDLAGLYSSADAVICPSWYESFPLVPLEAMACGAPVITTPHGTEDYAFHEENCLVVPPKDPKALAGAINDLLDNESLRENFKRKGPKIAQQFTWDKTVDKVERMFKEKLAV